MIMSTPDKRKFAFLGSKEAMKTFIPEYVECIEEAPFNYYGKTNTIILNWRHKLLPSKIILSDIQDQFKQYIGEMPKFKMFREGLYCDIEHDKISLIVREDIGADSIDVVAFSWLLSHPAQMIPITGSGEMKYVKKPVEALKYKLTPEQWYMIWTAVKGRKVL